MNITRSGFVLHLPYVLENLRATAAACKSLAHLTFVNSAITAFEEDGPDATPDLDGCPLPTARLIFEEVTEAYITASTALRVQERGSFLACDLHLPYTSHRRSLARRAERERRLRNATGLDRLRILLTIG